MDENTRSSREALHPAPVPDQQKRKGKSSIFSSSQWQNPLSQSYQSYKSHRVTEPTPSQHFGDMDAQTTNRLASSGIGIPSDNVINDTLGTTVRPTSVSEETFSASKPETVGASTSRETGITGEQAAPPLKDGVYDLHDTLEVQPKPKKKSSLKDTVKLYL